jgi:hypothetical protein
MTNQMIAPADTIDKDVDQLRNGENPDISSLTNDIVVKGGTIASLLDNLITLSDEDFVKGGSV